ncbi:MAG: carboxypeptidase regulatory-like domain-containing protein [Acidimicrobiia bacterium]|nr:carboxypeptidase regulatory-like domain-containing protein [Acidimicrobiia bacterium]
MRTRFILGCLFLFLIVLALTAQRERVEAVEISRVNTAMMPAGKEADGIPGDFILRNNRIHALISGGQPLRRANMTTEYGAVLQGVLYDLDLRGAENDQMTAFRPGGESGEVSWVRVAGEGVIEVVRTAAQGGGLYTRHEYRLEPGWQHLLITSTYRNESGQGKKIAPRAVWKGLAQEWKVGAVTVGDSIDPFDKRAYAFGPAADTASLDETELRAGEEKSFRMALAVADSPLAAYGVLAALQVSAGTVSGAAVDAGGEPALHASLFVEVQGQRLPAYPDAKGAFSFSLPAGEYRAALEDIGRDTVAQTLTVRASTNAVLNLKPAKASQVRIEIRDEQNRPSPAKVQFLGVEGTATPNFGTEYRVHGNDHQYQTHDGTVRQQVPPGKYLLRITRGPEFDLVERTVEVAKEQTVQVSAVLKRSMDTRGWISTDYHAHSTPSGDNYCSTRDRMINFAAEHVEFAPTTEHNRIVDWAPLIERLGLAAHLKTVAGIELTGSGQHFNAFPLTPDPLAQNGGAPLWNYDPRINAITLRNWGTPGLHPGGSRYDTEANARNKAPYFGGGPDRWVQANHPIVGNVFFDRNGDRVEDGGFTGFENMIDAAEFWSTEILNLNPVYQGWGVAGNKANQGLQNRSFGWLQLLNQGRRVWCVAVSDAHRIFGDGVGGWRTYVPSSTDEPARIDHQEIIRNSKAGRMMITNGPFLEVRTGDGLPIGSTVIAEGHLELKVKVQTPDWMDIDRVQVLINGRQAPQYNYTRAKNPEMFRGGVVKFEQSLRVALQQDAHLIVVAVGEKTNLAKGWGRDAKSNMHPIAYTNPIFVDVDRNGWQNNGDTLGHPLMVSPN